MTICRPKRVAKLKFRSVRIAWDFDQNQVQDALEKFRLGMSAKGLGLLLLERFHCPSQRLQSFSECVWPYTLHPLRSVKGAGDIVEN